MAILVHQPVSPIDDQDQGLVRLQALSSLGQQPLLQLPHQASAGRGEARVSGDRDVATRLADQGIRTGKCWGGHRALAVFCVDINRGV